MSCRHSICRLSAPRVQEQPVTGTAPLGPRLPWALWSQLLTARPVKDNGEPKPRTGTKKPSGRKYYQCPSRLFMKPHAPQALGRSQWFWLLSIALHTSRCSCAEHQGPEGQELPLQGFIPWHHRREIHPSSGSCYRLGESSSANRPAPQTPDRAETYNQLMHLAFTRPK